MVLSDDDAKSIFQLRDEIAGDTPDDARSRLLNLKNTWNKLEAK
jgi:hypothetical protein